MAPKRPKYDDPHASATSGSRGLQSKVCSLHTFHGSTAFLDLHQVNLVRISVAEIGVSVRTSFKMSSMLTSASILETNTPCTGSFRLFSLCHWVRPALEYAQWP